MFAQKRERDGMTRHEDRKEIERKKKRMCARKTREGETKWRGPEKMKPNLIKGPRNTWPGFVGACCVCT